MAKIVGFNEREQKIYDSLKGGKEKSIAELKLLFMKDAEEFFEKGKFDEKDVDAQAQSMVRNAVRRLIRDKWVEGPAQASSLARGTYRLSKSGKDKLEKGITETSSWATRKRGKGPKAKEGKEAKKAAPAKKEGKKPAPKKPTPKKEAKKAAPTKKPAVKASAKKPAAKAPAKKPDAAKAAEAKAKAQEAAKRAAQQVAQEKAQEAAARATETPAAE